MRFLKSEMLVAALMLFSLVNSSYAEDTKRPDEQKEPHAVETQKEVMLQHTEEPPVSGSASIGVFNRYIFRGYELSSDSFVVQPSVSVSYKYFSVSFWGSIDSDEHPTQSFVPDREGHKSFNETDLTLSYTYVVDKLSLTSGYVYYGTKYTAETEELFFTASYDTLLKPVMSVYRDINEYPGTYINLTLSHSLPVYKEMTFDIGASAGYFSGSGDYWNTFESSTGGYTGKRYSAFHDGMVKAGFTVRVAENVVVQPIVQYWFPLSSEAERTVDGSSYNHNGKLDDTFMTGMNMAMSF